MFTLIATGSRPITIVSKERIYIVNTATFPTMIL